MKNSLMLGAVASALVLLAGCGSSTTSNYSTPTTASSASAAGSPYGHAAAKSETSTASTTPSSSGGQTLSLATNAEGQLQYSTTSLTAKAGAVSIDFTNMAPIGHNVTVASASGEIVGSTPTFQGASKTLALNLKPGTYKFYCSVPGHRAAGMEGTLTVK